jgi:ribosomal protein S18 acetylase RimI-like enzyme
VADGVEVRRLGASDAAELARVLAPIVAANAETDVTEASHAAHLRRLLDEPTCYVFVAVDRDTPVGYVSAYRFPRLDHASDQVYVFDIEVAPGMRRRGVGRQLMNALLEACRRDGVTWAWAGTARENIAAQRLFASIGGERGGDTYVEYEFTP